MTVLSPAPTIVNAASATPLPVTGTTTALSVLATDEQSGADCTYTWSTTSIPNGAAAPTFSVNGANAAQNTTATFTSAGSYTFLVTVDNSLNLTVTSSVQVTVQQTVTTISVNPASASPYVGGTLQFSASGFDQFGAAMKPEPVFTWTTTVGQISSTGLLTAALSATSGTVTATSGAISQSSNVNVLPLPSVNAVYTYPDPTEPGKTSLYIYGTGSSDTILVNPATGAGVPKGSVTVLINGLSRGTFSFTGRIVIHGVAGTETIGVSPAVTAPAFIYGGSGNDVLWGGGGPNVIVGGTGSTKLYGGAGRSVLIAGASAGVLTAGAGNAIMIAGITSYDANDAALLAILDEWNSTESYATRVADIEGAGSDPLAQNGSYYLNGSTVHSNGQVNHISALGCAGAVLHEQT